MVNEELVGGLKNALERGASLKRAMMTFFNAGYDKTEIEEAAAILLNYPVQKKEIKLSEPLELKEEIQFKESTKNISKRIGSIPEPPVIQKVSNYEEEFNLPRKKMKKEKLVKEKKQKLVNEQKEEPIHSIRRKMSKSEKTVVIILVTLLVLLVGILVSIFLFRQQLIDLIGTLMA